MRAKKAIAIGAMLVGTITPAIADCRLEPGPQRTVIQALDGETLRLDDGSEVRLSGALAPRGQDVGADEQSWAPASAAKAALAALTEGRNVVLNFTGPTKRDRRNRHVAQVFIIENERETWVQGRMLSDGHARAYQQKGDRGCAAELLAHEDVARRARAGLWATDAYRARPAERTRDLAGLSGKFVVLTGRVAWVAPGRETIALGFSPTQLRAWSLRHGLIVMIENHDRELIGALGGDAKALEGKRFEVRGWLEHRLGRPVNSYVMDVSLAGIIIPLDADGTAVHAAGNKIADAPAASAP